MNKYFKKILQAQVYEVAKETPLEKANILSSVLNNYIYLKREDLQEVFSFKIRGAFNKMRTLTKDQLDKGVITSSAGNHAQGVALSAIKLSCEATIVMPITTPLVKINAVKELKASVILFGDNYDEAHEEALRISHEDGLCFIHPFDDPEVIAGQGTIGIEIISQLNTTPDSIYIAVGGGGLIAGVALYIKTLWPEVKIIGVEPEDANAMTRSLQENEIIELNKVGLFADGVAVKRVGEKTFKIAQEYVDKMITVNTDEICAAIKDVFEDTRSILEPAGALSIAGMKKDIEECGYENKTLVAIACGANMNFERLRFVAERAELGEYKEAMLAVEIPEKSGSLIEFCKLLDDRNLTEFSYRMSNSEKAQIFIGLEVSGLEDKNILISKFENSNYPFIDISKDELSKNHLRHMVGGRLPIEFSSKKFEQVVELLFRFEFPERPGALIEFLRKMKQDWSISVFHYRNHGADVGRIVIGVLINKKEINDWNKFTNKLGYKYWDETNNPTYKLFLGASNYI